MCSSPLFIVLRGNLNEEPARVHPHNRVFAPLSGFYLLLSLSPYLISLFVHQRINDSRVSPFYAPKYKVKLMPDNASKK